MGFEWDEPKSDVCFQNKGFDFAYAAHAFFDPGRLVHADSRLNYGEERFQVTGKIKGRLYVVVCTLCGEVTRIISARKANSREIQHYENSTNEN